MRIHATSLAGLSTGLVAFAGMALVAAAPASATSPNCTIGGTTHTPTLTCTLTGTGYSHFYGEFQFCSVSGCEYIAGNTASSGGTSKVTSSGNFSGHVTIELV